MSGPRVGYFHDAQNSITERIEAGPPSFVSLDVEPIIHDFKPTTMVNKSITGTYGSELVQPGLGVKVFQSGGGLTRIDVPFWARRHSRGDAEHYLWRMLVRLGRTDLGELCVHDRAYDDCWFLSGEGRIEPAWFVDPEGVAPNIPVRKPCFHVMGTMKFLRGLPSVEGFKSPAVPPPPEPPPLGTGRNLGDYRAIQTRAGNVIKLGRYCDMAAISVERPPPPMSYIPRCWGVRLKGRNHSQATLQTQLDYRRGRRIHLTLRGYVWAAVSNNGIPDPVPQTYIGFINECRNRLEKRIHDMQIQLRDEVATLTGNGNNFPACFLVSLDMDNDPDSYSTTGFTMEWEQSYNEVEFP